MLNREKKMAEKLPYVCYFCYDEKNDGQAGWISATPDYLWKHIRSDCNLTNVSDETLSDMVNYSVGSAQAFNSNNLNTKRK
jgi:hypothetical protein